MTKKGHKRITFHPQYLEVKAFKVRCMVIRGENCLTFFLHKTSKIFIPCQIRYPEETSKGAGLIRRALLTLTHASNMLGNFQSSVKGFIILTPRNGSVSSALKSPL